MEKLKQFAKQWMQVVTFLLAVSSLVAVVSAGVSVKTMAESNKEKIDLHYAEFRSHVQAQRVFEDSLNAFRKEMQLTRKANRQLYESVESLRRELIRKGIER